MSEVDDEVKGEGDDGEKKKQQAFTKTVIADTSDTATAVVPIQQTKYELPEYHKENDGKKKKEGACQTENDDTLTTVRLLGEPLVTHGPYTFYSALEYRKRGNGTNGERHRCKKQLSTDSCDSSSSCCCSSIEADNDSCSCSVSSSHSEWSVVRMNHFYAVRPWYSIRNSSDRQQLRRRRRRRRHRKNSSKLSTSTAAVERSQHHYQQSVCIGELELLWRDDSSETTTSVPSSSLVKKRSSNRVVPSPLMTTSNGGGDEKIDAITNSNSNSGVAASSDEDDGVGNDDDSPLMLPRRRMLPRRTRQPSAKKLEAAESCAAVAAAVSDNNPLQKSCNRSRQLTVPSSDPSSVAIPLSSPGAQYKHGNLLCSVRLYVMPDQTAAGRISGIHGEDEVLEINTWNANGGIDRWPGSLFLNGGNSIGSIYNGGGVDDYGYGSGSHSSGSLPSGCSGLVLRAEDFVEWVRGGLINDDDEIEDTESDNEFLESESGDDQKSIKTEMPEQGHDKQPKLLLDVKSRQEILHNNDKTKVKLESTLTTDGVKKEEAIIVEQSLSAIDFGKIEKDDKIIGDNFNTSAKDFFYDDNRSLNSAVNEAVKAERVPLAAAKIHKKQSMPIIRRHDQNCDSLVNGVITNNVNIKQEHLDPGNTNVGHTVDEKNDNNHKADCKRHLGFQNKNKKIKTCGGGSCSKQKLVVMSYSRYCRYRAQLQRRCEEQFGRDCITSRDDAEKAAIKYQGANTKTTTRVLFCRDTYDYPAELLLEPFKAQQGHHQNATVLVNHLAPKLKGWPAYPASWMSFRWNRVRRRLRHLERGSGDNEDRRRRRRRRKLKKTCRQRQNGTSGVGINYTSSTDDDYSDDSDSEDASSATNDAATNSTTTSSTSDSDGAPPLLSVMPKTVNKNLSSASSKVNGGVHHNTKKTLSVSSTSSMVIINGATTVSAVVNNKRNATSTVQPGLQQLTKRRRIIYPTGSQTLQHHQQRVLNQQQQPQHPLPRQQQSNHRPRQLMRYHQFGQSQRNQNSLVVQQQQPRLHSFHRRLPTPIASIQPATTRIIHHHLPPSVTIMPVVVPTNNTASQQQQQQQRFNNRLQNRQKHHSSATILSATSQRRNNISDTQQMSLPPVIIEYDDDDNHDYVSDDNGRYKKSTIAAAMVACQRRVEQRGFEDDQRQQREEDERQRRWLVNALRLGGLEVTAVPLNSNNSGSGSNRVVSNSETETPQQQQQKQWRQRGVSFETLLSTDNEHDNSGFEQHHGGDGDDDSIQESDSDSVVMTVTPDVICILNKSQQQESMETKHQQQMSRGDPTSTASITMTQQQKRRHSINLNNDSSSSSDQRQHPVVTAAAAAAALHDKINRAIDSLKQQQQKSNINTPISNNSDNVIVMGSTNHRHPNNSSNNKKQQKQRKNSVITGIRQQQTPSSLLDLSVKPSSMSNITTRQQKLPSPAITNSSLKQLQQQRKSQSPFHAVPMDGSSTAAASLEITIVPVTASSTTSSTKLLSQQQKRSLSATGTHNLTSGFETQSSACSSFPKMVRQQSQRRNATVTSSATVSESIIEMLCGGRNRNLHPQRNGRTVSVTTTSSSSQQQILEMAASATAPTQSQHQIDKRKPQQHKKD